MVKLITKIIIFLFLTYSVSCTSTTKFKKSFNNKQGVLIIPFTFKSERYGGGLQFIAVHKVGLLIEDLRTQDVIEEIVLTDPDEKFISIPYLSESEYSIKGVYLITDHTSGYRSDRLKSKVQKVNVDFDIYSDQFSYLNLQLTYFARPETLEDRKQRLKREGVNPTSEHIRLTSIYFEEIEVEKLEIIKKTVESRM